MPSKKSEAQTRKERIDPRLEAAGWKVVKWDPSKPLSDYDRCAIEEYPTSNGPADYVLVVQGAVLGVVEAKKQALAPSAVLTQAERYAKGLTGSRFNFRGFRVPFLYSTNGEVIRHHDVRHELNRSRQVAAFHTPDALLEHLAFDFDAACKSLLHTKNDHPQLREYQRKANSAVEEGIADRKRRMLVAMATGTGKTFTTVNQVYRLMKSGVAKRILFLVDRRALAAQAVRAFRSFEAEPGKKFHNLYEVYSQRFHRDDLGEEQKFDPTMLPAGYLTNPKPGHAFVYVCTIQRMTINLFGRNTIYNPGDEEIDADAEKENIPIHAFDLIIADECHRGYTSAELSVWRNTLNHFDAIKVGLTATPAGHTTAYFKNIIYRYGYKQALLDGYLVGYDEVHIASGVRINGVFLKEGDQIDIVDPESGATQLDILEDERKYDSSEIENKITAPDSNRKILEEVKKYALKHEEEYGRFPKTLIFAVNDLPHTSHCDSLVEIAREVFGRGESFVQKITGRVDRPLQRIREFRNRRNPAIVVTVDMLSTGVDIPDLEYIVLLRKVQSRILFEQMLGRGTRRGEHHPDKSHFTVFDCFDGTLLKYFEKATDLTAEPPQSSSRTIAEIIEDIWQNRDRDYNISALMKRLRRIERQMSGDARDLFAAYIPHGDLGTYTSELPKRLRDNFSREMSTLRNKDFQKLLVDYPRPKRSFVVAPNVEDTVTSTWLIRDVAGHEYKPADYLEEFARFVEEHADEIDAIRILLDRPSDWSPKALNELMERLKSNPLNFTLTKLQRVHEVHYKKALVDIISMVKHAARYEAPLLTAEERVKAAFARITGAQEFSEEQQKWLDRIHDHLVENLSIDPEDFDVIPLFGNAGGWGKANKVFDGELNDLLHRFNEAIAA